MAYSSEECPTVRGVVKQYREIYGILPGNRLEPQCAKHFASGRARVERGMQRIREHEEERAREKAEREARKKKSKP